MTDNASEIDVTARSTIGKTTASNQISSRAKKLGQLVEKGLSGLGENQIKGFLNNALLEIEGSLSNFEKDYDGELLRLERLLSSRKGKVTKALSAGLVKVQYGKGQDYYAVDYAQMYNAFFEKVLKIVKATKSQGSSAILGQIQEHIHEMIGNDSLTDDDKALMNKLIQEMQALHKERAKIKVVEVGKPPEQKVTVEVKQEVKQVTQEEVVAAVKEKQAAGVPAVESQSLHTATIKKLEADVARLQKEMEDADKKAAALFDAMDAGDTTVSQSLADAAEEDYQKKLFLWKKAQQDLENEKAALKQEGIGGKQQLTAEEVAEFRKKQKAATGETGEATTTPRSKPDKRPSKHRASGGASRVPTESEADYVKSARERIKVLDDAYDQFIGMQSMWMSGIEQSITDMLDGVRLASQEMVYVITAEIQKNIGGKLKTIGKQIEESFGAKSTSGVSSIAGKLDTINTTLLEIKNGLVRQKYIQDIRSVPKSAEDEAPQKAIAEIIGDALNHELAPILGEVLGEQSDLNWQKYLNLEGGVRKPIIDRLLGFNKGGIVPGSGDQDSVLGKLTPGEWIINPRRLAGGTVDDLLIGSNEDAAIEAYEAFISSGWRDLGNAISKKSTPSLYSKALKIPFFNYVDHPLDYGDHLYKVDSEKFLRWSSEIYDKFAPLNAPLFSIGQQFTKAVGESLEEIQGVTPYGDYKTSEDYKPSLQLRTFLRGRGAYRTSRQTNPDFIKEIDAFDKHISKTSGGLVDALKGATLFRAPGMTYSVTKNRYTIGDAVIQGIDPSYQYLSLLPQISREFHELLFKVKITDRLKGRLGYISAHEAELISSRGQGMVADIRSLETVEENLYDGVRDAFYKTRTIKADLVSGLELKYLTKGLSKDWISHHREQFDAMVYDLGQSDVISSLFPRKLAGGTFEFAYEADAALKAASLGKKYKTEYTYLNSLVADRSVSLAKDLLLQPMDKVIAYDTSSNIAGAIGSFNRPTLTDSVLPIRVADRGSGWNMYVGELAALERGKGLGPTLIGMALAKALKGPVGDLLTHIELKAIPFKDTVASYLKMGFMPVGEQNPLEPLIPMAANIKDFLSSPKVSPDVRLALPKKGVMSREHPALKAFSLTAFPYEVFDPVTAAGTIVPAGTRIPNIFKYLASGGPLMPGQTAVVGEEGPEMLVPAGSGFHVIPNPLFKAMGGARFLKTGTKMEQDVEGGTISPIPEYVADPARGIAHVTAQVLSDEIRSEVGPAFLNAAGGFKTTVKETLNLIAEGQPAFGPGKEPRYDPVAEAKVSGGKLGMQFDRLISSTRYAVTGGLIFAHVLRILTATSQVYQKSMGAVGRGWGYMLDMIIRPLLPAFLLITRGFIWLGNFFKGHKLIALGTGLALVGVAVFAALYSIYKMKKDVEAAAAAFEKLTAALNGTPYTPPEQGPGILSRIWGRSKRASMAIFGPFGDSPSGLEGVRVNRPAGEEEEDGAIPQPSGQRIIKYKAALGMRIPGYGGGDSVPVLTEPGELIVPKEVVRRFEHRAEGGVAGAGGDFGSWMGGIVGGAGDIFKGGITTIAQGVGSFLSSDIGKSIVGGLGVASKMIGAVMAPIAGVGIAIGAIKGGMHGLGRIFVKGQQAQIETAISVGKSQRTLLSLISIEGFGIIALLGLGLAVLNSILHAMPVATVPGVEGKGMLDILKDLFKSIWEAIKEGARSLFEWLKEKASGVWEWIKEKAAGIWERINEKAGGLWEFIKTKFGEVVEAIKAFIPKPVEAAKGVIDTVVNAGKKVAEVGDKFLGKGGTAALVGSAGLGVFTGGAEYLRTGDTGAALATGGMTAAGAFAFAKLLARFPKLGPVAGVAGYFARDSMIRDGATIGKAIAGPLGEDMGGIAASLVNDITAGAVTGSSIGGPVGAAGGAILGPIILGFKDLFAMKEEADKLASGLNLTPEQANAGGHLTNQYGFLGSVAATAYNTGVDLQGAPAVVGAAVTGGIDTATRAISDALTKAGDVLSAVVATVTGVVDAVIATVTAWQESAAAAGDTVREAILGAFASLGEYLAGLPSAIMEIIDRYLSGLPGIGGLFNSAKGALNIPSMASGGDILSDGVVNVHSGEAIIPARVNTNSNVRTDTTKTTITNHNTFVVQREDDRILFEKFKQMMVADSRRLVI